MSKGLVLVTGGCGYIGSHTILELWQNDFEVISIDNFSKSSQNVIKLLEDVGNKKLLNYNINLLDFEKLESIFKEHVFLGVIHFAAFKSVPESIANSILYYENNLVSLINLLKLCDKYKVLNFVFSSSCSVYGNISELPVKENSILGAQQSPYGKTKSMGEEIINDTAKNSSTNFILLRYFNPVGAHISCKIGEMPINKPDNLFPIITGVAYGRFPKLSVFGGKYNTRDGTCVRDFVHVSDIARAHILALQKMVSIDNSQKICETINLGTGNGITILEAIRAFENVSKIKLKYEIVEAREGDVVAIYSDNGKAKDILEWYPKYGINEMMHTAWEWEKIKDNFI
jgi:UDP-glucose 4-epimerase